MVDIWLTLRTYTLHSHSALSPLSPHSYHPRLHCSPTMLTLFTSPASLLARSSSLQWASICPTTLVAAGRQDTAPHGPRALPNPMVHSGLPAPPPRLSSCLFKSRSKKLSRFDRLCAFLRRKVAAKPAAKGSVVSAMKGSRAARAQKPSWATSLASGLLDRISRPKPSVHFKDTDMMKVISRCRSIMDWDRDFDRLSLPYAKPTHRVRWAMFASVSLS